MFPQMYAEVEADLLVRARTLHDRLLHKNDPAGAKKLQFLAELIERIEHKYTDV